MMTESDLGFVDSPNSRKIFVKAGDDGNLWYFWDKKTQKRIGIEKRSLKGYLISLKVEEYDTDFGKKKKLQVHFFSGENLCIQSGLDTWFSKSLLSSLMTLNESEVSEILTISVRQASVDSIVIFANLHLGQIWIKPDYGWRKTNEPDWLEIIKDINLKLEKERPQTIDPPF
ncbi:MAG: hypothetical protein ACRC2V_05125 [Xenococcaceae cyanobacterium]